MIVDAVSVALLLATLFIGAKAIRGFRQSKQAISESASLLEVIVNALMSRIQVSESAVNQLHSNFATVNQRSNGLEDEQVQLRGNYLQVLHQLQETLTNDRKFVLELEQLKTKVASMPQLSSRPGQRPLALREPSQILVGDESILSSLTPTERETIEIIADEGPKAAPDLGRRLKKSREHMARLMKKLYFEGYVDRESNRSPFRYRLNDKVRSSLGLPTESVTEKVSGRA